MLTGLLYAAVVALWAVVLLPRWLGTSDRYRDTRTSQRFRHSLRSVSIRGHRSHDVAARPGSNASRVDTAPADSAIDRHLDYGIDPFVGSVEDGHRRRARQQQAREMAAVDAAVRRRRILIGLLAATGVTFVGMILGFLSLTMFLIAAVSLVVYGYLLRTQAVSRRREALAARASGRESRAADTTADNTWNAVRSPEPSYMRAPRATAVPREIDATEEGPWTAERMLEQAAALRTGEDVEAELGLDEYAHPSEYAAPRAVNE